MKIEKIRIYCEVYEQGLYLKDYIKKVKANKNIDVVLVSASSGNYKKYINSSQVSKIKQIKKFDALITIISNGEEYSIMMFEFSTAFPTDDHCWQRFDALYWSAINKIPYIKISPTKYHNLATAGGSKMTSDHEKLSSFKLGGVYYHHEWPVDERDYVIVSKGKLSCPIYSSELQFIFNNIFADLLVSKDYNEFYNYHFEKFSQKNQKLFSTLNDLEHNNSERININNGQVTLKFNRFGHGMDPEKGMLIYLNTRYNDKVTSKFKIQRIAISGERGRSYNTLFEPASGSLGLAKDKALNVFENQNNKFSIQDALEVFSLATKTNGLFLNCNINNNIVKINDHDLRNYFSSSSSSTVKILFLFSSSILLTNDDDSVILKILWNRVLLKSIVMNKISGFVPLNIKRMSSNEMKEDIITYASQYLFSLWGADNVAVSYPGAQGDRAIISGKGKNNKRDYIDVISVKNDSSGTVVFLQENKEFKRELKRDILKLNNFIINQNKMNKLESLITFLNYKIFNESIIVGVGSKPATISYQNIDYHLSIDLSNKDISWEITSSKVNVLEYFEKISKSNNTVAGLIQDLIDIYYVD